VDDEEEPLVLENQPDVSRLVKVAAKYGIEIPVPIAVPKTSSCLSAMPLSLPLCSK
jgi:hypothetical protein